MSLTLIKNTQGYTNLISSNIFPKLNHNIHTTKILIPRASSKIDSPFNVSRKRYENKRIANAKENFNKMSLIVTNDIKDFADAIKECDTLHRKTFEDIKNDFEKRWPKKNENTIDEDNENIFLD